jgi:Transglutaminase-like superfamily
LIISIQTGPPLVRKPYAKYSLPPDVILLTVEDGSARLLDMAGGFYAVPAVGARLLQETLTDGADAAAAQVASHYGVARHQVQDDLTAFLLDLERQGLLCTQSNPWQRRRGSVALARLLLRPSLHGVHRLLRSPQTKARIMLALARLSFRLFGWTRTVAVWQEVHTHFPVQQASERDAETIQALQRAVLAAAAHPLAVACKERALCSWSLARAAGLHATLVVGVDLFPIAGHCWCEVGTQPLGDNREHYDRFTPVGRW